MPFPISISRTRGPLSALLPSLILIALIAMGLSVPVAAQMVTGAEMPGYAQTFGLEPAQAARDYAVQEVKCSVPANILWPGDKAAFTFRFTNKTDRPLEATGRVDIVHYQTKVPVGDVWVPHVSKLDDAGSVPITVRLPAKGSVEVEVAPSLPATFGGYALIADLGAHGRAFAAATVRAVRAEPGRVLLPTGSLDLPWPFEMTEEVMRTFQRLGVRGARMGADYVPTTAPDFEARLAELARDLKWAQDNNITVMLTVGAGPAPNPLGRPRPWLTEDNILLDTKSDMAWLPQYDADFQKWAKIVAERFGWPRGPVNAMELWNEPWEGISISGWGADMLRFRDMYTQMALGIEAARRNGAQVRIGGACSSSNTLDKLFPDGSQTFLKWLDFVSIHYQEMAVTPALVPEWVNRKGGYGRVQVWDTESWVANSEDRIAAVIASMRAEGQDRTNGFYGGNVYQSQVLSDNPRYGVVQAWSPAAAVAVTQKFIGQRSFKELLFRNGLPWVFVFNGLPGKDGTRTAQLPDDGTVVVVGDLGQVYNRNKLQFRSVLGLKNAARVAEATGQIVALPATASEAERTAREDARKAAAVLEDGSLTFANPNGEFLLYDFYGNPVASVGGGITVPLNGLGYYLRTNGARGSFARLQQALRSARIDGYAPLDIIAHDLTRAVSDKPSATLTLTNILNRPVSGSLTVTLGDLRLAQPTRTLAFAPHETKEVSVAVADGSANPANAYPLSVRFDAGADGATTHDETLHVNLIARRTIAVDGSLDDWRGVLPQTVSGTEGIGASLTEKAYLPFQNFGPGVGKGVASGYLAYDDNYFYFAAKIADDTPYEGNIRFENRDDSAYFYPEKSYAVERDANTKAETKRTELDWPSGVRRFSYRKDPDLPSGNDTDNVQIAFNVVPQNKKRYYVAPPGTLPKFMVYPDTDYEYALNQVAPKYGGGTEIWRLYAPDIPRKHFYPRQPAAPHDGGPVKNGKLAMTRQDNTRIVEMALPWSEIPDVKRRLDAGENIKFSFRVNDNKGPAYELATGRSVSKDNALAFHDDWRTHWANELEFGFEGASRANIRAAKP